MSNLWHEDPVPCWWGGRSRRRRAAPTTTATPVTAVAPKRRPPSWGGPWCDQRRPSTILVCNQHHLSLCKFSLVKKKSLNFLFVQERLYTVGCTLSRDILQIILYMFCWPLGWYCSHCAAHLVTRSSKRKQNKNIVTEWMPYSVKETPVENA